MLFHSFSSQNERIEFGGGDFLEFTFCKLDKGAAIEEIASNSAVALLHWSNSSLYLCGDDWNEFCDAYGKIVTNGTYANLEKGYLDQWGINYFSPEQMKQISLVRDRGICCYIGSICDSGRTSGSKDLPGRRPFIWNNAQNRFNLQGCMAGLIARWERGRRRSLR